MFNDQSFGPIGFTSQTSTEKSETTADTQTVDVARRDSEVQIMELKNAETQTTTQDKQTGNINYDKLAAFLKRITPSVLEELDEIHGSAAFDGYNPNVSGETSSSVKFIVKLNTLEESDPTNKISCVTWSPGGGTLALSYSATGHDTWCDHVSNIKFFHLIKEDEFSTESSKSLELNSCVTVLAYHPVERSILAAGLFNGDVLVWNLRDDKSRTPLQLSSHGDSVSVIKWGQKLLNNVSTLISASRDGYIFVNKLTANFTTVDLNKKLKITKEHNPSEKTRPRSASGKRERAVEPGLTITAYDISIKYPNTFVVGTLCGGLYKCNTDQGTAIEGSGDILDPVIDEFERHQGSVASLIFSLDGETFVTSGTDKEIRIYELSQYNSMHVIGTEDTAIGLSWLIGNANIFAAYGAGKTIAFYDIKNGKCLPNLLLETNDNETSCLEFNKKRSPGEVRPWCLYIHTTSTTGTFLISYIKLTETWWLSAVLLEIWKFGKYHEILRHKNIL